MVKFVGCAFILGRNSCWPRDLEPEIDFRIKERDPMRPFARFDRCRDSGMVIRTRGECDTFNSDLKESPIARCPI